jgi:hypothetical protein
MGVGRFLRRTLAVAVAMFALGYVGHQMVLGRGLAHQGRAARSSAGQDWGRSTLSAATSFAAHVGEQRMLEYSPQLLNLGSGQLNVGNLA